MLNHRYERFAIQPPPRLHERGISHPAITADNVTLIDDASARRVLAARRAISSGELDTDLVMDITASKVLDAIADRHIAGKTNGDEGNGFDYVETE